MQKYPKVVILRTGNMKFYKGVRLDVEKQFRDELRFGGGYVAQHHDGGEAYNFAPWYGSEEERLCLGFVETMSSGDKRRRILVENILGCEQLRPSDPAAEDVLVVWCARIEEATESVRVMGWYHHATVFREYQEYPIIDENGEVQTFEYNVSAPASGCVLLPVKERFAYRWRVPRGKHNLGRSNIWYARENPAFVEQLVHQIEEYEKYGGENWLDVDADWDVVKNTISIE